MQTRRKEENKKASKQANKQTNKPDDKVVLLNLGKQCIGILDVERDGGGASAVTNERLGLCLSAAGCSTSCRQAYKQVVCVCAGVCMWASNKYTCTRARTQGRSCQLPVAWLPPPSTKRRTNGDLVLLAAQKIVEAWAGNKASAEQKNLGPGKQANKTE